MRKLALVAAVAATLATVPAFAQDAAPQDNSQSAATADAAPGQPSAPDGSKFFGFVPYFGVMGGWEGFDRTPGHGIPATSINGGRKLQGALIEGVVGANLPLGPVFIGAEGNVAKGIDGAIDWEYGAAGRFGFRAGDSGLFYGKVGYKWVNFDRFGNNSRDFGAMQYGIGFEAGPKDIGLKGITGNAGFRLRGEVSTYGDFNSFKPMLGIVTHF